MVDGAQVFPIPLNGVAYDVADGYGSKSAVWAINGKTIGNGLVTQVVPSDLPPGVNNLSLTVTNSAGKSATAVQTLAVVAAKFTASIAKSTPDPVYPGLPAKFVASSTGAASPIKCKWTASVPIVVTSDGSLCTPYVTFSAAGPQTLTLAVTGATGKTAFANKAVTVAPINGPALVIRRPSDVDDPADRDKKLLIVTQTVGAQAPLTYKYRLKVGDKPVITFTPDTSDLTTFRIGTVDPSFHPGLVPTPITLTITVTDALGRTSAPVSRAIAVPTIIQ